MPNNTLVGDCKALKDLLQIYSHFIIYDLIDVRCHSYLWYKTRVQCQDWCGCIFRILSMIYNPIMYDLRLIKLRH